MHRERPDSGCSTQRDKDPVDLTGKGGMDEPALLPASQLALRARRLERELLELGHQVAEIVADFRLASIAWRSSGAMAAIADVLETRNVDHDK